jgi:hypothetical protein
MIFIFSHVLLQINPLVMPEKRGSEVRRFREPGMMSVKKFKKSCIQACTASPRTVSPQRSPLKMAIHNVDIQQEERYEVRSDQG